MKWWVWVIVGTVVMIVTTLVGLAMYKREKRGNVDTLEKARLAKAEKAAAKVEETPAT